MQKPVLKRKHNREEENTAIKGSKQRAFGGKTPYIAGDFQRDRCKIIDDIKGQPSPGRSTEPKADGSDS